MSEREQKAKPDFKQLNDRYIQPRPKGTFFGIKTNLDPDEPEAYNPYSDPNNSNVEQEKLKDFFYNE